MHCVDVNVLVQACVAASPRHALARSWLLDHRSEPEGLGLFSVVVSGFLRVATDRRVFSEPLDPAVSTAFWRLQRYPSSTPGRDIGDSSAGWFSITGPVLLT
jgi:predicted nucleic acid-binding protein